MITNEAGNYGLAQDLSKKEQADYLLETIQPLPRVPMTPNECSHRTADGLDAICDLGTWAHGTLSLNSRLRDDWAVLETRSCTGTRT